jgi:hypothetical protein
MKTELILAVISGLVSTIIAFLFVFIKQRSLAHNIRIKLAGKAIDVRIPKHSSDFESSMVVRDILEKFNESQVGPELQGKRINIASESTKIRILDIEGKSAAIEQELFVANDHVRDSSRLFFTVHVDGEFTDLQLPTGFEILKSTSEENLQSIVIGGNVASDQTSVFVRYTLINSFLHEDEFWIIAGYRYDYYDIRVELPGERPFKSHRVLRTVDNVEVPLAAERDIEVKRSNTQLFVRLKNVTPRERYMIRWTW